MPAKRLSTFVAWLVVFSLLLSPFVPGFSPAAAAPAYKSSTAPALLPVNFLGQIGGESQAVAYASNLVYVGVGPRLVIVDVSTPSAPVVLGETEPFLDLIQGIHLDPVSGFAFLALGTDGVAAVDISDSANPVVVDQETTLGLANDLYLLGSTLLVADDIEGVRVFDVDVLALDPLDTLIYNTQIDTAGEAYDLVAVVDTDTGGTYVYVADGTNGVVVIDIPPAPGTPTVDATVATAGDAYGIDISANLANLYVAEGSVGMQVITLVPAVPAVVATYGPTTFASDVKAFFLGGLNYALLADEDGGLRVLLYTAPSTITQVGSFPAEDAVFGVEFGLIGATRYALLADGVANLRLVNLTSLANPQFSGAHQSIGSIFGADVPAPGTVAYTAGGFSGLYKLDVSDRTQPVISGFLDDAAFDFAEDVAVTDNYAFQADGFAGLHSVDVGVPGNPELRTTNPLADYAYAVVRNGSYAFVANGLGGLQIVNATDPANSLADVGSLAGDSLPDFAYDLVVEGDYAYLADGLAGLVIVDVSDPTLPFTVSQVTDPPLTGMSVGVAVANNYAFMAQGLDGLHVVDVNDPANPVWQLSLPTNDSAEAVAVAGKYVLVADGLAGLTVFEVTDWLAPTLVQVDQYDTAGYAVDLRVAGAVYLATSEGGLYLLDIPLTDADLAVTKTNGSETAVPGSEVVYTVTVANNGPADVVGAVVTDTLPVEITGASWSCTASSGSCADLSGTQDISTTVDLLAGGMATFTITGTIADSATGTLANTAYVSTPAGITDPNLANNSAADVDTLTPEADLSITKTNGVEGVMPGDPVTYTVTVASAGPTGVTGASVTDTLPAELENTSWTCTPSGGAACGAAAGTGDLDELVDLPAGGQVVFSIAGTIAADAAGLLLTNTASVAPPAGVVDPNPENNTATDNDAIGELPDLAIDKSVSAGRVLVSSTLTYTLTVTNVGLAPAESVVVTDQLPAGVAFVSASTGCAFDGVANTVTCDVGVVAVDEVVALTVVVTAGEVGLVTNTATVSDDRDINPANDTASVDTEVFVYQLYLPYISKDVGEN